jgi:uncharacterized protein (DUF305 family)
MQNPGVRRLAAAGIALAAAAVLAACGGSDHDGGMDPTMPGMSHAGSSGGTFNDADVRFATDMIPHHQQAVTMAQAAATRASSGQVKELAAAIAGAQGPEIATMSGWLARWGRPVPSGPASPGATHSGMPGMGHSSGMPGMDHGAMPGMLTDRQLADLTAASGAAFDKLFLQLMIEHHRGAIEMAGTEQRQGRAAEVRQLAATIAANQAAEVTRMQDLLRQLP